MEVVQSSEAQKKQYESVMASLGTGVIEVDTKLKVISINKFALTFFHKRKVSTINDHYWHFFLVRNDKGKKTKDAVRLALRKVMRKGKKSKRVPSEVLRVFVRIPKEGVVPLSVNVSAVFSDNDKLTGAVISFRDVAEEAEVDKMKSEVVSLAAHQLRAPMTSIRWNIELFLNGEAGKVSAYQKELLHDIYDSNTRMLKLVNDLLNIARLEEGRVRVEPVNTNLKEVIATVVKTYKDMAVKRKCKVQVVHNVTGSPSIKIDPGLVHEALKNYLTNAIKYSRGAVKVVLEKEKYHYRISVVDNGIGIPPKDKKKIFTKFYRSDEAGEIDPLGSGLGLYIVKMIVRISGGRVGVTSNKDGTTFYLLL
ncbi:MAG: PAS domain-containing sensor histidine kinase, partial [bacterium]|nr:PAS domain-containing sensor histidine kinase [bacterium]